MAQAHKLTTWLTNERDCRSARKFLADRSLLSRFERKGHGIYSFEMFFPSRFTEASAREVANQAVNGMGVLSLNWQPDADFEKHPA